MDIKELKIKPTKELHRLLASNREKLRELRFKDANKQLKNVRELRLIKKTISRILTLLNQNKVNNEVKKEVKDTPVEKVEETKAKKEEKQD